MTDLTESTEPKVPAKRGRGRPKKSEIAKAKKPGKPGRPPGTAAVIKDYTSRMLASPKSEAIIHKVMDIALSDDHPDAQACRKLIIDRAIPISGISQELEKSGGRPQISINITGMKDVEVQQEKYADAEDGEIIEP